MNIPKWFLNPLMKKLQKEIKDETGYEAEITFKDPISLKVKDGGARLHINVEAMVDANVLLKLMEEMKEE